MPLRKCHRALPPKYTQEQIDQVLRAWLTAKVLNYDYPYGVVGEVARQLRLEIDVVRYIIDSYRYR